MTSQKKRDPGSRWVLAAVLCSAMSTAACGGETGSSENNIATTYRPEYSVSEGQRMTGNYFPLEPGVVRRFSRNDTGTITTMVDGSREETEKFDEDSAIELKVLPEESVTLSTGTKRLIPVEQTITPENGDSPSRVVQYYERGDDGTVYVRAQLIEDVQTETPDAMLLKAELVVGDSWITVPTTSATNSVGASAASDATTGVTTHVIGPETITVRGKSMETLRLDHVGHFTVSEEETRFDVALVATVHLALGVGLVAEHVEIETDVLLTINGQTVDVQSDSRSTIELQTLRGRQTEARLKARVLETVRAIIF